MPNCASTPASRSTSVIRTAPGSAAPTRTRTACCGSISPKAPTSPATPVVTSRPSRPRSTPGLARRSSGRHPPRLSTGFYTRSNKTAVLRRLGDVDLGPDANIERVHRRPVAPLVSAVECEEARGRARYGAVGASLGSNHGSDGTTLGATLDGWSAQARASAVPATAPVPAVADPCLAMRPRPPSRIFATQHERLVERAERPVEPPDDLRRLGV